MIQLPSLELVAGEIISLVTGHVIERANRTEWYVKIIRSVGLEPNNIPNTFDGLYVYTLVAYGMGKSKATLNLFREELVKDAFRQSFERKDSSPFFEIVGEFLESEEGKDIGFPKAELRYEFEGFKTAFEIFSNRSRNVHEIQGDIVLGQMNEQIGFVLDELTKLKKEQDKSVFSLEKKIDAIPLELKLEKSKSGYDEIRRQVSQIRTELQSTLNELRPQIVKFLKREDIAEFDKGSEEVFEILTRLESGLIWVTFFGNTNAGKSSIANSLIGEDLAEFGIPHDLTIEPSYYEKPPWKVVDVPGILGERVNEEIAIGEAKKAHGLVFVITGEPLGPELKLFELVHNAVRDIPVIVFFNKWDEMENKTKKNREIVRSLVKKKMRKFVKSDEDIVYGSAQLFDRDLDVMVRQPLPQLVDRMYANVGIFGEVVQLIDPANRAVDISSDIQKRLFEARSSLARRLIRYFGWASIVGNVMAFDELLVTPGLLATMTYVVSNVMGVKVTKEKAVETTVNLLKVCAQDLTMTFIGVAIASTVLSALGPIGLIADVATLSAIKYSRTVTLGEVLIEYIRTEGTWDNDRHKAIVACRERANKLYGKFN